jgi:hypothetical protein
MENMMCSPLIGIAVLILAVTVMFVAIIGAAYLVTRDRY